jgi:cyclase
MKRLIFSLLYEDGHFVLSRNFRRQKVGDLTWLFKNYNLTEVSFGIDEIIIIDVSKKKNPKNFCKIVEKISSKIFIPITVGGGINSIQNIKNLQSSGADKILLNKLLYTNQNLWKNIVNIYGKQFVVACVDYRIINKKVKIVYDNNLKISKFNLPETIRQIQRIGAGEIILQSVDNDGTGKGLFIEILNFTQNLQLICPLILKGGIGKFEHIYQGLKLKEVDAVCTANLFNFIGDTFLKIKKTLLKKKINVIDWNNVNLNAYKNVFKKNND